MEDGLSLKSFKGVLWNVAGRLANQAMGFAMGIILARIIAPESYGLIAMAMVVIGVTSVFVDGGFAPALIRKLDADSNDYSTVFWFNTSMSVFIYTIIFFTAPLIEKFFNASNLSTVIRFLSINILISAFVAVQNVQLTKKLDFKAINILSIISTFISGVIGIYLAYRGFEVWALVVQQIISRLISAVLVISYNRWIPLFIFSKKSFRGMWNFGSKLFASGVLSSISIIFIL
jgi:O-antigen/teichoic acid export membrane protein